MPSALSGARSSIDRPETILGGGETYPGITPFPLIEPVPRNSDIQTSIGLQDVIRITQRLSATLGYSADHFDGLQGHQYNAPMTALLPFTCIASPTNAAFSGCTAHVWNNNPQAAVSYQVTESGDLFLPPTTDVSHAEGHLFRGPGRRAAHPNLRPEHSYNWNAGYS